MADSLSRRCQGRSLRFTDASRGAMMARTGRSKGGTSRVTWMVVVAAVSLILVFIAFNRGVINEVRSL